MFHKFTISSPTLFRMTFINVPYKHTKSKNAGELELICVPSFDGV